MSQNDKEAFDWLDDPFDEKKTAHERESMANTKGTKFALGCGCALVIVVLVALMLVMGASMLDVLTIA